jgi:hypothetical protein
MGLGSSWLCKGRRVDSRQVCQATPTNRGSRDEGRCFIANEHLLAEAEATAIKRVVAFQPTQYLIEQQFSKAGLARRRGTSRSPLDRLLDPDNASVTLVALERAAKTLGQRIRIQLAD